MSHRSLRRGMEERETRRRSGEGLNSIVTMPSLLKPVEPRWESCGDGERAAATPAWTARRRQGGVPEADLEALSRRRRWAVGFSFWCNGAPFFWKSGFYFFIYFLLEKERCEKWLEKKENFYFFNRYKFEGKNGGYFSTISTVFSMKLKTVGKSNC